MLNIACFEEPTQCLQLTAPTPKGTASVRDFSVCTGLLAITSLCELCMTLKPFSPKPESSCQRGNAGMGANPNLPLQRRSVIGTHFSSVYTTRLSSSSSVHWVRGAVLALTQASFFGVVLPHLLLLGQEGLGA